MSPLFPKPVEQLLSIIAGLLIVVAQVLLLNDVYKRKIKPSLLSWLGWALLMGTSLVSQIESAGWHWSLVGLLLSTIGCLAIFILALLLNHFLFKKSDRVFLLLGLACLAIYLVSKDPWLTTVFAILADFVAGFPTIQNAYAKPETQKTDAWSFGLVSWLFSLVICVGHGWLFALFPIYLFFYNATMVYLTAFRHEGRMQ